jgi:GMP synthase (glutamine-hydrolysing)
MHELFESPAAINSWLQRREYPVTWSHLSVGEPLPKNADDFDFLLVMGGPQSPHTTKEECAYFDGPAEINLIKQALDADKYVLGVCLGAQLIGEAMGAKHERSPHKEIGIFPVELSAAGQQDAIFSQFPQTFMSAHWHNDMPGLPAGAEVLASSEACPRQIIRFSDKAYGLQCHMEFNKEVAEGLLRCCPQDLVPTEEHPYIDSTDKLLNYDYSAMNRLLYQFLDNFLPR